jgi:hypothetical protein
MSTSLLLLLWGLAATVLALIAIVAWKLRSREDEAVVPVADRAVAKVAKAAKAAAVDPPPHTLVLMMFCKNEGWFIEEWLDHHAALGVDRVMLLNDQSTDDTLLRVQPYVDRGFVEVVDWDSTGKHGTSRFFDASNPYNIMLKRFQGTHTWLLGIDADEFVNVEPGRTFKEILRAQEQAPAVTLNWMVYGGGGHHLEPTDHNVKNSYRWRRERTDEINTHVKTCVNLMHSDWQNKVVQYTTSHGPEGFRAVTPSGRPSSVPFCKPAEHGSAFLCHYMSKSFEYYRRRKGRGEEVSYNTMYWFEHAHAPCTNVVRDTSMCTTETFAPCRVIQWQDTGRTSFAEGMLHTMSPTDGLQDGVGVVEVDCSESMADYYAQCAE